MSRRRLPPSRGRIALAGSVLLLVCVLGTEATAPPRSPAGNLPAEAAAAVDWRKLHIGPIPSQVSDPHNLADHEPSIAVYRPKSPDKPEEIDVVAFSGNWHPDDASVMAPVWRSSNGGKTWVKVHQIPRPANGRGGPADQSI